MQLKSVLQSTAFAVSSALVEQSRTIYLPDIANALDDAFGFIQRPITQDDYAASDGLKFLYGRGDGFVISALTLFNDGIYCQGSTTTDDLHQTIVNVLDVLRGLAISVPIGDLKWLYNSQVEVVLEQGFSTLLDKLDPVARTVRQKIEGYGVDVSHYGPSGVSLGGEGPGVIQPGRFVLERRAGRPVSENVFYSEAPLATREHVALLGEIDQQFLSFPS